MFVDSRYPVVLRLFPNCPFAAIPRNSDEIADETAASAGSFNVERPANGSTRQIKIADKSNFLEYIKSQFEKVSLGIGPFLLAPIASSCATSLAD
jgi:hypothetical protein